MVSSKKQNTKNENQIEIEIPSKEKIQMDKERRMHFHLCAYFVCNTLISLTMFIPSSHLNGISRMVLCLGYFGLFFYCMVFFLGFCGVHFFRHSLSLIQKKCLRNSLKIILATNTVSFVLSIAASVSLSRWFSKYKDMVHLSECAIVSAISASLICITYYGKLQSEEDQKSQDCNTGINATEKSRPLHIFIHIKDLDNRIEHKVIQLDEEQCCVLLFLKKKHETENTQCLVEFPKIVTEA